MLYPPIKLMFIEDAIQPIVKGIPRRDHDIARCDPKILLSFALPPSSHRHVGIDDQNITKVTCFYHKD
jgi:hypothetical protein